MPTPASFDVRRGHQRCRGCNGTERYTLSGSCIVCVKAASAVTNKSKRRARKAKLRREEAKRQAADDLSDLLGPDSARNYSPSEAAEDVSEFQDRTLSEAESQKSLSTTYPGVIPIVPTSPVIKIGEQKGGFRDQPGNSEMDSKALPGTGARIEGLSETPRHWCHAESGCVWKTLGEDRPRIGDGFVEEISAEAYADLVRAGFTESVNDDDDLDDILG